MSTDPSSNPPNHQEPVSDSAETPIETTAGSSAEPGEIPTIHASEQGELEQLNPMVVAAIGLILLAFLPFVGSTRGTFLWLDDATVLDNPFIKVSDGIARFWTSADTTGRYEPLTEVTYWLQYHFFHLQPAAYRLANVLLHAAVVILLWTLLSRLAVRGAWLAAAIFAVHPVHTQAIAWVSGRSIILASMFYLSSMLVYLRYVGITPVPPGSKTLLTLPSEPERLWGLALALFACALASNPVAITLPLALALIIWWKRERVIPEQWLMLLPFFVISAGAAGWVWYLQASSPLKQAVISAYGTPPPGDQIEYGLRAISFYALKIVAPLDLNFDYPRFTPSMLELGASTFSIVIVLVTLFALKAKIGRGPFVAALLFVLAILPELGLLDAPALRYSFVADYRQYLASAALITLIVSVLATLFEHNRGLHVIAPYVGGVIVAILFFLSDRAAANYVTSERLWSETYRTNKSSLLAADGYAEALRFGHHLPEAREWSEHAEKIAPGDPRAKWNLGLTDEADAYDLQHSGQPDQAAKLRQHAVGEYETALALDPDYAPAATELGDLRARQKDDAGAITAYTQAINSAPTSIRARLGLAGALRRTGKLDDASAELYNVLDIDSNIAAAHTELGNVFLQKKMIQDALDEWAKAAVLEPLNTTVLLNYGALLASSGKPDLAAKQFFAATRINPNLSAAFYNLGLVELQSGHNQNAVIQFNHATELDPSESKYTKYLGIAKEALRLHGPGTMPSSQPSTANPFAPPAASPSNVP